MISSAVVAMLGWGLYRDHRRDVLQQEEGRYPSHFSCTSVRAVVIWNEEGAESPVKKNNDSNICLQRVFWSDGDGGLAAPVSPLWKVHFISLDSSSSSSGVMVSVFFSVRAPVGILRVVAAVAIAVFPFVAWGYYYIHKELRSNWPSHCKTAI